MKNRLSRRLKSVTKAAARYPAAALFLAICTALTIARIAGARIADVYLYQLACAAGAAAGYAAQSAAERFSLKGRWAFSALAVLVAAVFYAWARSWPEVMAVRLVVLASLLFVAAVWLPSVKSHFPFYEIFTASFKAVFQAAFFSGVLFAGCAAVVAAVDALITPVDADVFAYLASVVFIFIMPMLYLSLIPLIPAARRAIADGSPAGAEDEGSDVPDLTEAESNLPGAGEGAEGDLAGAESGGAATSIAGEVEAISEYERRVPAPPFLRALVSFILVPIAFAFTLILVLYILKGIAGPFWEDNLLEPLLISYCASVTVLLLLAAGMESAYARAARLVLPKALLAVAAFQIVASAVKAQSAGLTHGRYFVLAFGVFAVVTGAVLSIRPRKWTGLVAAAFLLIALVSLIPPTDALSTAVRSQTHLLESALAEEGMLRDGAVVPSVSVSGKNKEKIVSSLEYLFRLGRQERLSWLPRDFDVYSDRSFQRVFGFSRYESPDLGHKHTRVAYPLNELADVSRYDAWAVFEVTTPSADIGALAHIAPDGSAVLRLRHSDGGAVIELLSGKADTVLASFDVDAVFERFEKSADYNLIPLEEARFTTEGDGGRLLVVAETVERYDTDGGEIRYARLHVFAGWS